MATLTVTIDLENDAYVYQNGNVIASQVGAALRKVAKRIEHGDRSGRVIDDNGNTSGSFAIE
jgi:hypothetical protein